MTNQQIPEYSDYMYLQGYKPYEIMRAHDEAMLRAIEERDPLTLNFTVKVDYDND